MCGELQRDVVMSISKLRRSEAGNRPNGEPFYSVACESCKEGIFAIQNYSGQRNWIRHEGGQMYGDGHRGKYHPGLGEFVHDYAHKQRLLKEQGVREAADPIGGSRTVLGDSSTIEQHFDSPDVKQIEAKDSKDRQEKLKKSGFTWL
jgi:hypothetical protein